MLRGSQLDSWHPHDNSVTHPSVIPASGFSTPSSDLHEHQSCTCCTYLYAGKHSHIQNKINKSKKKITQIKTTAKSLCK